MKDPYNAKWDLNLFPQRVTAFLYPFETNQFFNQINQIKTTHPNNIKNYPPDLIYQTPFNLFKEYQIFKPLENFIEKISQKNYNQSYKVIESWANISYKYSSSHFHDHGSYDLAGIFYLQYPPHAGKLHIHSKHNPITESQTFQPIQNSIFMFNGFQPHSTSPHLDDLPKISIAFNLRALN